MPCVVINQYGVIMEAMEQVYQTTRDDYALKAIDILAALNFFPVLNLVAVFSDLLKEVLKSYKPRIYAFKS